MKTKINYGFTLLELMVVTTVLAVLLSIATPSFQTFIQNSRLNSEVERVYSIFNAARQEALASGSRAMVCKGASIPIDPDAADCGGVSGSVNTTAWNSGFISYRSTVDMIFGEGNARFGNHRINHSVYTNEATLTERQGLIIQSHDFKDNGVTFIASAVGGSAINSQQRAIAFNGDGTFLNAQTHGYSSFRIAICDGRGEAFGKYIEINLVGRLFLRDTGEESGDVGCDGNNI